MNWFRRMATNMSRKITVLESSGNEPIVESQGSPRIFISQITFSDNTRIHLEKNSILVVTGPNNTGKSSILREIRDYLREGAELGPVVRSIEFKKQGSIDSFRELIESQSVKMERDALISKSDVIVTIAKSLYRMADIEEDYQRSFVGKAASITLFSHLAAGERLAITEPKRRDDYLRNAPSESIQWLELDENLETKVAEEFERTFRMKLILNRFAGQDLMLHVCEPNDLEDAPNGNTRAKAKWLASLPLLHRQGDGMRSYTGTLLAMLIHPKSLLLLDEPEAFLHPPQARRLAAMIAQNSFASQIVTATHNDEFVRSILDVAGDRVVIVRLERRLKENKASVLNSSDIKDLWIDPLLRTSDVLSALFHDAAIICEGESDARFLRAVMESTEREIRDPDIRLFHFGGKDRIERIAKALIAIRVPVIVVVDIDVLADRHKFLSLYESLGGKREKIEDDLTVLLKVAGSRKGQLNGKELSLELERISVFAKKENQVPDEIRNEISQLIKGTSIWQRIKEDGYRAFVDAGAIQAFERIFAEAKSVGLLINPEGELEGFCRQIPRSRKSEWLAQVLRKDLGNDPTLAEARKFIDGVRECILAKVNRQFS